jgi:DNA-binding CsgD family transcriptional regulator
MGLLTRIDAAPLDASVLTVYSEALEAIGSAQFQTVAAKAVRRIAPVDRLYVFDGDEASSVVACRVHEVEPEKVHISHLTYSTQYLPTDPVQQAIRFADSPQATVMVRVAPEDIAPASYRRMLQDAGIAERVSFIQRAQGRWRCLTVARKTAAGGFSDQELSRLGDFTRLFMPMVYRHQDLAQQPGPARSSVDELEERFSARFPELTRREREVCARAAIGMTVEGAALDLDIGKASVLTYRKRAYQRLGVTSPYELAQLVMR